MLYKEDCTYREQYKLQEGENRRFNFVHIRTDLCVNYCTAVFLI